jgi:hypothetical protein
MPDSKGNAVKSLLSSTPVLWFLFLFNLVVARAAGFDLHGTQQIMTSAGMGVVALGAGAGIVRRRATQPDTRQLLHARK